jgi:lysophospholipase L1-like esterase
MKFSLLVSLLGLLTGTALYVDGAFIGVEQPFQVLPQHRFALGNSPRLAACDLPSLSIMPLGDSITYGTGVEGGYRLGLWNSLLQDNLQIDFVGSRSDGPFNIDPDHEGHPGKTIQFIRENIRNWLNVHRPDIILLLIGTNDILNPQVHDFPNAPYRLSALIDQITTTAPGTDLLVASVTPLDYPLANQRVMAFNAEIPAIVAAHAHQGQSVYFVDMFAALSPTDLGDGIHPNAVGYDKMAQVWYKALSDLLEQHCQNIPN